MAVFGSNVNKNISNFADSVSLHVVLVLTDSTTPFCSCHNPFQSIWSGWVSQRDLKYIADFNFREYKSNVKNSRWLFHLKYMIVWEYWWDQIKNLVNFRLFLSPHLLLQPLNSLSWIFLLSWWWTIILGFHKKIWDLWRVRLGVVLKLHLKGFLLLLDLFSFYKLEGCVKEWYQIVLERVLVVVEPVVQIVQLQGKAQPSFKRFCLSDVEENLQCPMLNIQNSMSNIWDPINKVKSSNHNCVKTCTRP